MTTPIAPYSTFTAIKNTKRNFIPLSIFALTSASLFLSPSIAMAAAEPIVPTTNDTCGVENDTTNLPFSPDISWERFTSSGREYVSGTVSTNGQLSQTFYALPSLSGDTFPDGSTEKSYTFNFTDESCNIVVEVEAVPPIFTDNFGSDNDTYTIPSAIGNAYFINNYSVNPGTYPVTDPNMVVIVLPMPGYSFADGTPTQYLGNFTSNPIVQDVEIDPFTPDFIDMSGTANDVYVIPADDRVTYLVDGAPLPAGSYPGAGTVTVTLQANPGYVFSSGTNSSYAYAYSPDITDFTLAYPDSVTRSDQPGKSNDTYTVPSSEGVEYVMNGQVIQAGTYPAEGNVIIDARPMQGYMFIPDADTRFDYTFSNEVQFSKPFVVGGNTIFIPEIEGVEYSLNGVVTAWGYYDITRDSTVTMQALPGFTTPAGAVLEYNFTYTPTDVNTPTTPATPSNPENPLPSIETQTPVVETTVDTQTLTNGTIDSNSSITQDAISTEDTLANTALSQITHESNEVKDSIFLGFGVFLTALGVFLSIGRRRKA